MYLFNIERVFFYKKINLQENKYKYSQSFLLHFSNTSGEFQKKQLEP